MIKIIKRFTGPDGIQMVQCDGGNGIFEITHEEYLEILKMGFTVIEN